MLKVHLQTGETLSFDLTEPVEAKRWLDYSSVASFQEQITGITVLNNGVSYSVPKPRGFGELFILANDIPEEGKVKGGTKVSVHSDNITTDLTVYRSHRAARIAIRRAGWQIMK
jgi:hypothetical protein